MLVEKFELNPLRRPSWAWLEHYLTPERDDLKRKRLDYRKGARASRLDTKNKRKLILKAEVRVFFFLNLFL